MNDGLNLMSEQTRAAIRVLERALSHAIKECQIHAVMYAAFHLNFCAGVFRV